MLMLLSLTKLLIYANSYLKNTKLVYLEKKEKRKKNKMTPNAYFINDP